jgi:hypothetical protein
MPKWSYDPGQIHSDQLHDLLERDCVCDSVLFCWIVTGRSIVMSPYDLAIDLNNALDKNIKNCC